jgi:hypothetical protein
MTKVSTILFALLAPVLVVLLAVPIAVAHVAAHVLIDRIRRADRRGAPPTRIAAARTTRPTWESPSSPAYSGR